MIEIEIGDVLSIMTMKKIKKKGKEERGKRKDLGLNPSIRDGERAALVDETVEVLSYVRCLLWRHLRIYLPKILPPFSREMPHQTTTHHIHQATTTTTSGSPTPTKQSADEPHLYSDHSATVSFYFSTLGLGPHLRLRAATLSIYLGF